LLFTNEDQGNVGSIWRELKVLKEKTEERDRVGQEVGNRNLRYLAINKVIREIEQKLMWLTGVQ